MLNCCEPHNDSEAKCNVFIMQTSFHSCANKTNFHLIVWKALTTLASQELPRKNSVRIASLFYNEVHSNLKMAYLTTINQSCRKHFSGSTQCTFFLASPPWVLGAQMNVTSSALITSCSATILGQCLVHLVSVFRPAVFFFFVVSSFKKQKGKIFISKLHFLFFPGPIFPRNGWMLLTLSHKNSLTSQAVVSGESYKNDSLGAYRCPTLILIYRRRVRYMIPRMFQWNSCGHAILIKPQMPCAKDTSKLSPLVSL